MVSCIPYFDSIDWLCCTIACDGLPLSTSMCPLLLLWPLLPSVGHGSESGAAFCCKGWAFGPLGPFSNKGPFLFWVYQHGMISPLSCISCWWPTLPNFTSLSSPSFLSVAGLGAPLSSSLLKRRYISLQNEWMNEWISMQGRTVRALCDA